MYGGLAVLPPTAEQCVTPASLSIPTCSAPSTAEMRRAVSPADFHRKAIKHKLPHGFQGVIRRSHAKARGAQMSREAILASRDISALHRHSPAVLARSPLSKDRDPWADSLVRYNFNPVCQNYGGFTPMSEYNGRRNDIVIGTSSASISHNMMLYAHPRKPPEAVRPSRYGMKAFFTFPSSGPVSEWGNMAKDNFFTTPARRNEMKY